MLAILRPGEIRTQCRGDRIWSGANIRFGSDRPVRLENCQLGALLRNTRSIVPSHEVWGSVPA